MTAQEIMFDQFAEGKKRKREENEDNIYHIRPMKCQYVDYINSGRQEAIIIGAYLNNRWSQYVYAAYHIIKPDGTKTTIPSKSVIRTRVVE